MKIKTGKEMAIAASTFAAALLLGSTTPAAADTRLRLDLDLIDLLITTECAAHPADARTFSHAYSYGENNFHEALSGYGEWVYHPAFGEVIWFPYVDPDWRPYVHGHWINTSRGMTWVAYEEWGWIPHHYGRWVYFDRGGWGWFPGYDYGAAWVTWGIVDGHVGWAPLPPAGYRYPNHVRYSYAGDDRRYGYSGWTEYDPCGIDFSLWVFVPNRYFYNTSIYRYSLPSSHCDGFFHSRRVLPVGDHMSIHYARRITNNRLATTSLERTTQRFGGREVTHYRPLGQKTKIQQGRELARKAGHISTRGDRSLSSWTSHSDRPDTKKPETYRAPGGSRTKETRYNPQPRTATRDESNRTGRSAEKKSVSKRSSSEKEKASSQTERKNSGEKKKEKSSPDKKTKKR